MNELEFNIADIRLNLSTLAERNKSTSKQSVQLDKQIREIENKHKLDNGVRFSPDNVLAAIVERQKKIVQMSHSLTSDHDYGGEFIAIRSNISTKLLTINKQNIEKMSVKLNVQARTL